MSWAFIIFFFFYFTWFTFILTLSSWFQWSIFFVLVFRFFLLRKNKRFSHSILNSNCLSLRKLYISNATTLHTALLQNVQLKIFRSKNKLKVMTQYGKKRTICAKCFVVKNKKKKKTNEVWNEEKLEKIVELFGKMLTFCLFYFNLLSSLEH